ncbi:helix-turn-helix domain-containing protein [Mesorhizobium sp. B2-5-9]|uniref:helix-turn-helix domain-containing protein n=1 Tax=Mesorhizobium sp. B2-5-9 TaxID=2589921 RepID=UPI0015E27FB7|nr:helix-turn-helix domain-containing protein [Mesorhizobium sp. B2-5-9]
MTDHPLIQAFPEYFLITPVTRAKNPWLDEMLRLIVRRVFSEGPGAIATILRLSEIIFIETIRASGERSPALRQILSAFEDPQIGKAIQTIHRRSEQNWTVASLALEVGMSRTQFAERFKEMIGDGPLGYLTNWRLQRAQGSVNPVPTQLREVARRSGYASAAAFTRAFRQKFGEPPTAQREARVATRAGSE